MCRLVALTLLAAVGAACASGESSSDGGPARVDAMPLPDSGARLPDAGGGEPDPDGDPGNPAGPVINELVAYHQGSGCELLEVAGSASTSYDAYSLLVLDGDGGGDPGLVQRIFPVGTTSADGLWVTATLPANTLQNGAASYLLVEAFTGDVDDDLDAGDDGTFDVEPWTALVDSVSVDDATGVNVHYGEPVLLESFDGGDTPVGGASRIPDGTDTDAAADWVRNDSAGDGLPGACDQGTATAGEALNTPGEPNTVQL